MHIESLIILDTGASGIDFKEGTPSSPRKTAIYTAISTAF
jgi:hypothetical protein